MSRRPKQWKMVGTIYTPKEQIVVAYAIDNVFADVDDDTETAMMETAVARFYELGCGYFTVRSPSGRAFNVFAQVTHDHPVTGDRWHRHLL